MDDLTGNDKTDSIASMIIPAQGAQIESDNEQTPNKPKARDTLQNNWPVIFQTYPGLESPPKIK